MTTQYNLDDYNKIVFGGLCCNLSNDTMVIINALINEINKSESLSSTSQTTTYQKYPDNKYKKLMQPNNLVYNKRSKLPKSASDTDWQTVRVPFKTTQIEKKEGIEKSVNEIRICLNKISNKNYDTQRDAILELLKIITEKEVDEDNEDNEDNEDKKQEEQDKKGDSEIKRVALAIFDIASNNKFFSEIYADLYNDLINKYSIFNEIISPFIKTYTDSIREINYVDPNVEYDKFCEYNKKNDRRKALSAFITNLMKKGILQKSTVIDIILLFQELVFTYIDEPNKSNEVEEITENIFILVTSSYLACNGITEWATVLENIVKCSQFKTKDKAGLSNRAIFKYMDILDNLKKKV